MTDLTTPNNTTAATSSTTAAPASGWEREALRDMLQEHVRAGRSARRWSWFKRGLWLLVIVGFAGWLVMQSSIFSAMRTSSGLLYTLAAGEAHGNVRRAVCRVRTT